MAGTASGVLFVKNGKDIHLTVYQGKTIEFSLTWGGSTPIDVTGYDARMQIRPTVESTTVLADFNVSNGRVTVGGVDGLIEFTMTAEDCALITAGKIVYDIEVINPAGDVFLVQSGGGQVIAEVTR